LPSRVLSPNARVHWRVKAAAAAAHRRTAEIGARTAGPLPSWESATMQCVFYWPDKRRRDDDNAMSSTKAYRDGIADSAIVRDDSSIRALPTAFNVDKINPRLELFLAPADAKNNIR
jgi:crossover junction endodeoxyribonuclease RusA